MGRKSRIVAVALSVGLVVIAACRDTSITEPTGATAIADWRAANVGSAPSCTPMTLAQLYALTDSVFAGGGPNSNAVKSKIDQVDKAKKKGDAKKTNEAAFNANRLVFQKFKGPQPLAGTNAQVARLISGIFCFAGINITISDPANSNIIDPSSTTQVVKSQDSTAGTRLPPGSITEPTVLEFTKVPNTFTTPGAGPLNTRLDQYPGFYLIQSGNASGTGPAVPVIVAICPDASVPASIRSRLRLGHEKSDGFEITPAADASFLNCPAPTNLSFLPGWAGKALSALMPKTLYAAIAGKSEAFVGGVGGTASEFSPFDPVDATLEFAARGGVGGTAGEFTTRPTRKTGLMPQVSAAPTGDLAAVIASPGAMANTLSAGTCTAVEAPWSSELEPECRPRLEMRTRLGTPLRNVPLTWSVTAGDGTIAAGVPGTTTCTGAFAASITFNTSSDSGKSGVCWKMGPTLGTNTVTVTPGIGGDVPPGVTYVPAIPTFNATAIKATPTVNISCPVIALTYNGADQTPCTASVTDSIHGALSLGAVPVTYGPTAPPRDAGTYTADAAYAGTALYNAATGAQKTFDIARAASAVTVTCPASVPYTGSAQTPCSATVTGDGGLNEAVAPVMYTDNVNAGTATASATYAQSTNYLASSGSATFAIAAPPPSTWNITGPGTTALLKDGSAGIASMSYDYNLGVGGGVATQTWSFSTTAQSAGTFKQSYSYNGLHAWFAVTVFVRPYVIHNAVKTYVAGAQINQGPINCCTAPSNGFTITGSATFTVAAGDTYGFEIGGGNGDYNSFINATFATARDPLYVNYLYARENFNGHNCYHDVVISVVNASTLRWTNACGPSPVSWLMYATANPAFYTSGPDYPYYGTGADVGFTLTFGGGGVIQSITGPGGEPYTRVP